ncbi:MAG: hypothetical protein WDZ77_01365 [Candidatus Pacearchaeota archaeon]
MDHQSGKELEEHEAVKEELVTLFEFTLELEDDFNNFISDLKKMN